MTDALRRPMSLDEFLAWENAQETRHEFVDGVVRLMTGARRGHEKIALNIAGELRQRLKGSPCQAFTANMKVVAPTGNVRYPDVMVECGRYSNAATFAEEPILVVEVLSPSNTPAEIAKRVRDYASIPTVAVLLLVESDLVSVTIYRRRGDLLVIDPEDDLRDLADIVPLPEIGTELPLAEIYFGLELPDA